MQVVRRLWFLSSRDTGFSLRRVTVGCLLERDGFASRFMLSATSSQTNYTPETCAAVFARLISGYSSQQPPLSHLANFTGVRPGLMDETVECFGLFLPFTLLFTCLFVCFCFIASGVNRYLEQLKSNERENFRLLAEKVRRSCRPFQGIVN